MKLEIRKNAKISRKNEKNKKNKDNVICNLLLSNYEFSNSHNILFYYPIKDEVDIKKAINDFISSGKRAFLPVVDLKNKKLIINEIESIRNLTIGPLGIPEPKKGNSINIEGIDLIVVPGVAFDPRGYRIGYGKGYYDRLLTNFKGQTIGIAYESQIINRIPNEKHDIPVKMIITEKRIIKCGENGRNNGWQKNC